MSFCCGWSFGMWWTCCGWEYCDHNKELIKNYVFFQWDDGFKLPSWFDFWFRLFMSHTSSNSSLIRSTQHLCNSFWFLILFSFLLYVMDLINSRLVQMQLHLKLWNLSSTRHFFSLISLYDVNWFSWKIEKFHFIFTTCRFCQLPFDWNSSNCSLSAFGLLLYDVLCVWNWKTQLNQWMANIMKKNTKFHSRRFCWTCSEWITEKKSKYEIKFPFLTFTGYFMATFLLLSCCFYLQVNFLDFIE